MADRYLDGKGFMKVISEARTDLRLVLLFGTEEFYIDNCIKSLKKVYLAPGSEDMDLNLIPQDSKAGFEDLEGYIQMPPWMSSKRVIICRSQTLYSSEFGDREEKILMSIPESCLVVFAPEKAEKNRRITKFILKNGVAGEIDLFPEDELIRIIRDSLGKNGISIDRDAASSLVSRCESKMRLISSEIEKMRLFCAGSGRKSITFDELENMCPPDLNASIFTITDCFGTGKCDNALKTLNSLLIRKEPIQRLRATLITHLKRLIIAKDTGDKTRLATELKCSPYYAGNLVKQSSRFTLDRLIELLTQAVKSESDVRHGLMEDRTALETLIVKASMK